MHLCLGALLVLGGLSCLRYVWAGETAFASEPPLLALSVLLVATGMGLAMRARAARLLAYLALGVTLLVLAAEALRFYGGPRDTADESLVAHAYLFGLALAAAGVVVLFLLLRRVRARADFGPIDSV